MQNLKSADSTAHLSSKFNWHNTVILGMKNHYRASDVSNMNIILELIPHVSKWIYESPLKIW